MEQSLQGNIGAILSALGWCGQRTKWGTSGTGGYPIG